MARAKVILIDTDVISHFIAANRIFELNKILAPHHLFVTNIVYNEAIRHPYDDMRKDEVDDWINNSSVTIVTFPEQNKPIKLEYWKLRKQQRLGKGECSCMAMARFGGEAIASSNFRDIVEYCEANDIEYIGVMDILSIALLKKIWSAEECNRFIHDVTIIGDARLPVSNILDYKSDRDLSEF